MSTPSNWPLDTASIRFVLPHKIIRMLSDHPLTSQLYPLGAGYYQEAAGHRMQRQEHDDNLVIYCLEGAGKLTVNGRTWRIKSGDLIILPRGQAHQYASDQQQPWSIYWSHFSGSESSQFIRLISEKRNRPVVHLGIHSKLISDFQALLDARQTQYHLNTYLHAANQLRQILTHIAVLLPLSRGQIHAAEGFDLEKVHSLMQARLHEQLDLDTLAASVNLSKYHFIKKYKELTDTTPINHFIHLKIERACQLLDSSHRNVTEIALQLGYEDAYYFSRVFKKVMGISPSQYRKLQTGAWAYPDFTGNNTR